MPGDGISMKWFKDGVEVPRNQTLRQPSRTIKGFAFNENILMLKKVLRQDSGNYTCVVTTSQNPGYLNKVTARLLVKGISAEI